MIIQCARKRTQTSSKDPELIEASGELVTILLKATQQRHLKGLQGSGTLVCRDTDLKLRWLSYPPASASCLRSLTLCHNF